MRSLALFIDDMMHYHMNNNDTSWTAMVHGLMLIASIPVFAVDGIESIRQCCTTTDIPD